MGRMGPPNIDYSQVGKSPAELLTGEPHAHSRKAHSKPLPDNNSKHEPLKFVSGVGWHPGP